MGHTVIAYRTLPDLHAAVDTLTATGFNSTDLLRCAPDEMKAQVDAKLPVASRLASICQELNLIKSHRALAEGGCSFLLVNVPKDEHADRVAVIAHSTKAVAAQHYGRFIVEELIDTPSGEMWVFESPERGLDLQVPTAKCR